MKSIYNHIENIKSIFIPNLPQNDILDPLSTIIRLCINKYLPLNTKIYIANNKLILHQNSFTQGPYRAMFGYEKKDLHKLYIPITVACKYYLKQVPEETSEYYTWEQKQLDEQKRIMYIDIFKLAVIGLQNLKKTYKDYPIISHCIIHYIHIINTNIKKQITMTDSYFEVSYDISLYDQFTKNWNDNLATIIFNILKQLESTTDQTEINFYITSIENIMSIIDNKIYDIMHPT
jgi:hypothetical protein